MTFTAYLIIGLFIACFVSILTAVFSIRSARKHKAEVKRLKSEKTFLQAELDRAQKIREINKEISEEIHEIKKPLHSGSNADRFNASLNVLQNLTAGNDPNSDDPA